MPQELHVLRCYKCEVFQVHIVKKTNKWECKMCYEKQSVKQVYGRGSGKDCRIHVQKLNELRMKADESVFKAFEESDSACGGYPNEDTSKMNQHLSSLPTEILPGGESKWNRFLDVRTNEEQESDEESNYKLCTELKSKKNSKRSVGKSVKSKTSKYNKRGKTNGFIADAENSVCDNEVSWDPQSQFESVTEMAIPVHHETRDVEQRLPEAAPTLKMADCGKWGKYLEEPQHSSENDWPEYVSFDSHFDDNAGHKEIHPQQCPDKSGTWDRFLDEPQSLNDNSQFFQSSTNFVNSAEDDLVELGQKSFDKRGPINPGELFRVATTGKWGKFLNEAQNSSENDWVHDHSLEVECSTALGNRGRGSEVDSTSTLCYGSQTVTGSNCGGLQLQRGDSYTLNSHDDEDDLDELLKL